METKEHKFVICVRKVYEVLPDPEGAKHGLIRVIDESGEDYLFPVITSCLSNLPLT
jgi:hypothetical protein